MKTISYTVMVWKSDSLYSFVKTDINMFVFSLYILTLEHQYSAHDQDFFSIIIMNTTICVHVHILNEGKPWMRHCVCWLSF